MYEQGFTQKTKKNKPGANKKNKPENRKQKNKEKQRNKQTWKNPGFDLFLFFFSGDSSNLFFFCGEPVFDYVVNVFFVGCHFFCYNQPSLFPLASKC